MTRTGVRTRARGLPRRVALLVAVLAVLAGTAACTTAGGPEKPAGTARTAGAPAGLREAARATEAAGSARVESATTIGSAISLSAQGVLGWADGVTGTLTLTCTGGTLADTLRRLGSTTMQARYLPDAYYARMGDAFAAQAGGRHWVRYAYDDLDSLAGGSGAPFGDHMRDSTPDRSLRLLLASEDVRRVGSERVRGERTTRYSGTVDAGGTGVTEQTVDVWIDERGLLVKKVEKGRTASGELIQTAYYGDYGAEVSAERPPASDTRDFADLVGASPGGGA
ncbi:hypothetical protein [Streptomyces sp.]|uniref:hypothetical protein n=1 Tax=Streptomyces sp. TaxID=1931 RepID=UPI002D2222AE|nr:hypothetical protein [Streptomyces sp.]HZF87387.1 hypothetical protein [Streptomyces sp.]